MHERPYLFKAPLVRATLAGTKTETRRVLRGAEVLAVRPEDRWEQSLGRVDGVGRKADRGRWFLIAGEPHQHPTFAPRLDGARPGAVVWAGPKWPLPGDSLWVRETWRAEERYDDLTPCDIPRDADMDMMADNPLGLWTTRLRPGKTRTSIHMPRWASRITRKITEMRVERLQDITEEGAVREGLDGTRGSLLAPRPCARTLFRELWDTINAPKPDKTVVTWEANPLVVVTVFEEGPS